MGTSALTLYPTPLTCTPALSSGSGLTFPKSEVAFPSCSRLRTCPLLAPSLAQMEFSLEHSWSSPRLWSCRGLWLPRLATSVQPWRGLAKPSTCCLRGPQPTTTEPRPGDSREMWQVRGEAREPLQKGSWSAQTKDEGLVGPWVAVTKPLNLCSYLSEIYCGPCLSPGAIGRS